MIVGVGTGRSGTRLWASYLRAAGVHTVHEPYGKTLPGLRGNRDGLAALQWPEAAVSYQFAALLPELADALPSPRWVWVTRDPYLTVASMIHNGWYARDLPWNFTGPQVGDVGQAVWDGWGQLERCAWWVGYANRQIARWLPTPIGWDELRGHTRLMPGECLTVDVGVSPGPVLRLLGLPPINRRHDNVTSHPQLTDEQKRIVDAHL